MADTEWELRIDQMVRQNIGYWWQIYADQGGPEVDQIQAGQNFYLHFGVQNFGSEVHFDSVDVRLVPLNVQGQDRITFLDDGGAAIGRTHLRFNNLSAAGTADEIQRSGAFFTANENLVKSRGGPVAFALMRIGIYARVRPEGHHWRTAAWV